MARPNILVVMADGWRRQALGCAGVDPVLTPNFDRLAAQGTRFECAITNHPLCTPARAAFLTGRYAPSIGMAYNWQRVPIDEPNLATATASAGYDTALIGKWHLDDYEPDDPHGNHWNTLTPPGPRRLGFRHWYSNGCDHHHFRLRYVDTEGELHEGEGWQIDHETDMAVRYLRNERNERPSQKPFCLWLNWSPPHNHCGGERYDRQLGGQQYYAPEEYEALYRDRELPAAHPDVDEGYARWAPGYFGCVSAMDDAFGRLMRTLDDLGLSEDTIVLVTGDHGEMLSIHGRYMKGIWYEESIGIPLLVRWPGRVPNGAVDEVSLIGIMDLTPTLLGMAGIDVPPGRDGRDLSEVFLGRGDAPQEPILVSHNTGAPPPELTRYDFPIEKGRYWRGLRTPTHTYVCVDQRPETQYYDPSRRDALPAHATRVAYELCADPHQMSPIVDGAGQDDLLNSLHSELVARLDAMGDDFLETCWSPTRTG